ncbi:MAG: acyltransferase family protein [Nocardioidaceae bacterium]
MRQTALPSRGGGIPRRRPLDGLRALAVTGVLLYHGGVSWADGGFLGVDLFFVLSGFLIMSLLLDEQRRTGRLDLMAFWGARARRLLPAVALLLVVVLWVLPALGARWGQRVAGDAWAAAGYVSNWWFIGSDDSYVDQANGPSPLLHTWSLAIEEQWYVVLPLLLVLAFRLGLSRRLLTFALLLSTVGSAAMAWWLHPADADPSRAYFGTDTRVQALLVGSLAALLVGGSVWHPRDPVRSRRLSWLAVPGAVLLLGLAAVANPEDDWLYAGGLLAVALACVLLVVGSAAAPPESHGLSSVLSSRPFVALGLISYGVYLWHWPVYLALDEQRTGLDGLLLLLLRVAVTVSAATASYLLVELPVRRQVWRRWRRPYVGAPALAAVAGAVVVAALVRPAAPAPVEPGSMVALARLEAQERSRSATRPDDVVRWAAPSPASAGARLRPTSPHETSPQVHPVRSIVLVGDSQALSLFAAVRNAPGTGLTLHVATRFGCGVVPYVATAEGVRLTPQQPLCGDWAKAREWEIASASADLGVLFAGGWEQYERYVAGRAVSFRDPEWLRLTTRGYRTVLEEMSRHVDHLAVALNHCHDAPEIQLPVTTLYRWGRYPPVVNDSARVAATNRAIRAAAAGVP